MPCLESRSKVCGNKEHMVELGVEKPEGMRPGVRVWKAHHRPAVRWPLWPSTHTFPCCVLVIFDDSRQAKVCNLAHEWLRDQDVSSSQITVDVVLPLDVRHAFCNLQTEGAQVRTLNRLSCWPSRKTKQTNKHPWVFEILSCILSFWLFKFLR